MSTWTVTETDDRDTRTVMAYRAFDELAIINGGQVALVTNLDTVTDGVYLEFDDGTVKFYGTFDTIEVV